MAKVTLSKLNKSKFTQCLDLVLDSHNTKIGNRHITIINYTSSETIINCYCVL